MTTCSKCGKQFETKMARCGHQAHCGLHTKKECPICHRFIPPSSYDRHVRSHDKDSTCLRCGKTIYAANRRFCSQSCSASFNGVGRVRNGKPAGNCLFCGNKLSLSAAKYCSSNCHKAFLWSDFIRLVESSGYMPLTSTNNKIKKFLIYKHGHVCSICKGTKWNDKPIPLVLDHIDGHWDNTKLDNLRLVCGNCDMQLPTYKGKNKGNGRFSRRKRYAEGKSY